MAGLNGPAIGGMLPILPWLSPRPLVPRPLAEAEEYQVLLRHVLCRLHPVRTLLPARSGAELFSVVRRTVGQLSGGLAHTTRLTLTVDDPDDGDAPVLMLRHRQSVPVSIHAALRRFDAAIPGVLGGLLSELRSVATVHAPLFTSEDLMDGNPYGGDAFERDNTLYNARSLLQQQYAALKPDQLEAKLLQVSFRDAARLVARHGELSQRDEHRLGYTLGRNILRGEALDLQIAALPPALQTCARQFRQLVQQIDTLKVISGEFDPDRFEDFGSDSTPAFVVTPHPPAHRPHDLFLESWREQYELNWNSWTDDSPLFCVKLDDPAVASKLAEALRSCALALPLVWKALCLFGAVPLNDTDRLPRPA